MRGEDYVRGICVSFQPIYILRIRAPQKSTFYDIIPLDISTTKFHTILALNQIWIIFLFYPIAITLSVKLHDPSITWDVKLGNPPFCGSRGRRACHFRRIPSQVTRVNKVVK